MSTEDGALIPHCIKSTATSPTHYSACLLKKWTLRCFIISFHKVTTYPHCINNSFFSYELIRMEPPAGWLTYEATTRSAGISHRARHSSSIFSPMCLPTSHFVVSSCKLYKMCIHLWIKEMHTQQICNPRSIEKYRPIAKHYAHATYSISHHVSILILCIFYSTIPES